LTQNTENQNTTKLEDILNSITISKWVKEIEMKEFEERAKELFNKANKDIYKKKKQLKKFKILNWFIQVPMLILLSSYLVNEFSFEINYQLSPLIFVFMFIIYNSLWIRNERNQSDTKNEIRNIKREYQYVVGLEKVKLSNRDKNSDDD
jgi:ABC-type multidrug transport system fused ATPase/permease subunit